MTDGLTIIKFLDLIGWGDWFNAYVNSDAVLDLTFSDLVFGTLPYLLQLFFVILLLNWIMGIIADVVKIIARGGHL